MYFEGYIWTLSHTNLSFHLTTFFESIVYVISELQEIDYRTGSGKSSDKESLSVDDFSSKVKLSLPNIK